MKKIWAVSLLTSFYLFSGDIKTLNESNFEQESSQVQYPNYDFQASAGLRSIVGFVLLYGEQNVSTFCDESLCIVEYPVISMKNEKDKEHIEENHAIIILLPCRVKLLQYLSYKVKCIYMSIQQMTRMEVIIVVLCRPVGDRGKVEMIMSYNYYQHYLHNIH